MKASHHRKDNSGAVIIESVIILSLFLFLTLGFAQQYLAILAKLTHYRLATELLLGPQERSIALTTSVVSGATVSTFSKLTSATSPTMDEYLNTLGNQFLSRAGSEHTLYAKLGYLDIQTFALDSGGVPLATIGRALGFDNTHPVSNFPATPGPGCSGLAGDLNNFAQNFMRTMSSWQVPATAEEGKIGVKLYKVRLNSIDYEEFISVVPITFLLICTQTINVLTPMTAVSIFPLVPRRLTR